MIDAARSDALEFGEAFTRLIKQKNQLNSEKRTKNSIRRRGIVAREAAETQFQNASILSDFASSHTMRESRVERVITDRLIAVREEKDRVRENRMAREELIEQQKVRERENNNNLIIAMEQKIVTEQKSTEEEVKEKSVREKEEMLKKTKALGQQLCQEIVSDIVSQTMKQLIQFKTRGNKYIPIEKGATVSEVEGIDGLTLAALKEFKTNHGEWRIEQMIPNYIVHQDPQSGQIESTRYSAERSLKIIENRQTPKEQTDYQTSVYPKRIARILAHIEYESGPRLFLETKAKTQQTQLNGQSMRSPMSLPLFLCVLGPPRTGKTLLAKSLAQSLSLSVITLEKSLQKALDESEIGENNNKDNQKSRLCLLGDKLKKDLQYGKELSDDLCVAIVAECIMIETSACIQHLSDLDESDRRAKNAPPQQFVRWSNHESNSQINQGQQQQLLQLIQPNVNQDQNIQLSKQNSQSSSIVSNQEQLSLEQLLQKVKELTIAPDAPFSLRDRVRNRYDEPEHYSYLFQTYLSHLVKKDIEVKETNDNQQKQGKKQTSEIKKKPSQVDGFISERGDVLYEFDPHSQRLDHKSHQARGQSDNNLLFFHSDNDLDNLADQNIFDYQEVHYGGIILDGFPKSLIQMVKLEQALLLDDEIHPLLKQIEKNEVKNQDELKNGKESKFVELIEQEKREPSVSIISIAQQLQNENFKFNPNPRKFTTVVHSGMRPVDESNSYVEEQNVEDESLLSNVMKREEEIQLKAYPIRRGCQSSPLELFSDLIPQAGWNEDMMAYQPLSCFDAVFFLEDEKNNCIARASEDGYQGIYKDKGIINPMRNIHSFWECEAGKDKRDAQPDRLPKPQVGDPASGDFQLQNLIKKGHHGLVIRQQQRGRKGTMDQNPLSNSMQGSISMSVLGLQVGGNRQSLVNLTSFMSSFGPRQNPPGVQIPLSNQPKPFYGGLGITMFPNSHILTPQDLALLHKKYEEYVKEVPKFESWLNLTGKKESIPLSLFKNGTEVKLHTIKICLSSIKGKIDLLQQYQPLIFKLVPLPEPVEAELNKEEVNQLDRELDIKYAPPKPPTPVEGYEGTLKPSMINQLKAKQGQPKQAASAPKQATGAPKSQTQTQPKGKTGAKNIKGAKEEELPGPGQEGYIDPNEDEETRLKREAEQQAREAARLAERNQKIAVMKQKLTENRERLRLQTLILQLTRSKEIHSKAALIAKLRNMGGIKLLRTLPRIGEVIAQQLMKEFNIIETQFDDAFQNCTNVVIEIHGILYKFIASQIKNAKFDLQKRDVRMDSIITELQESLASTCAFPMALRCHDETKAEMHLRITESIRALLRAAQRQRDRGHNRAQRLMKFAEEKFNPLISSMLSRLIASITKQELARVAAICRLCYDYCNVLRGLPVDTRNSIVIQYPQNFVQEKEKEKVGKKDKIIDDDSAIKSGPFKFDVGEGIGIFEMSTQNEYLQKHEKSCLPPSMNSDDNKDVGKDGKRGGKKLTTQPIQGNANIQTPAPGQQAAGNTQLKAQEKAALAAAAALEAQKEQDERDFELNFMRVPYLGFPFISFQNKEKIKEKGDKGEKDNEATTYINTALSAFFAPEIINPQLESAVEVAKPKKQYGQIQQEQTQEVVNEDYKPENAFLSQINLESVSVVISAITLLDAAERGIKEIREVREHEEKVNQAQKQAEEEAKKFAAEQALLGLDNIKQQKDDKRPTTSVSNQPSTTSTKKGAKEEQNVVKGKGAQIKKEQKAIIEQQEVEETEPQPPPFEFPPLPRALSQLLKVPQQIEQLVNEASSPNLTSDFQSLTSKLPEQITQDLLKSGFFTIAQRDDLCLQVIESAKKRIQELVNHIQTIMISMRTSFTRIAESFNTWSADRFFRDLQSISTLRVLLGIAVEEETIIKHKLRMRGGRIFVDREEQVKESTEGQQDEDNSYSMFKDDIYSPEAESDNRNISRSSSKHSLNQKSKHPKDPHAISNSGNSPNSNNLNQQQQQQQNDQQKENNEQDQHNQWSEKLFSNLEKGQMTGEQIGPLFDKNLNPLYQNLQQKYIQSKIEQNELIKQRQSPTPQNDEKKPETNLKQNIRPTSSQSRLVLLQQVDQSNPTFNISMHELIKRHQEIEKEFGLVQRDRRIWRNMELKLLLRQSWIYKSDDQNNNNKSIDETHYIQQYLGANSLSDIFGNKGQVNALNFNHLFDITGPGFSNQYSQMLDLVHIENETDTQENFQATLIFPKHDKTATLLSHNIQQQQLQYALNSKNSSPQLQQKRRKADELIILAKNLNAYLHWIDPLRHRPYDPISQRAKEASAMWIRYKRKNLETYQRREETINTDNINLETTQSQALAYLQQEQQIQPKPKIDSIPEKPKNLSIQVQSRQSPENRENQNTRQSDRKPKGLYVMVSPKSPDPSQSLAVFPTISQFDKSLQRASPSSPQQQKNFSFFDQISDSSILIQPNPLRMPLGNAKLSPFHANILRNVFHTVSHQGNCFLRSFPRLIIEAMKGISGIGQKGFPSPISDISFQIPPAWRGFCEYAVNKFGINGLMCSHQTKIPLEGERGLTELFERFNLNQENGKGDISANSPSDIPGITQQSLQSVIESRNRSNWVAFLIVLILPQIIPFEDMILYARLLASWTDHTGHMSRLRFASIPMPYEDEIWQVYRTKVQEDIAEQIMQNPQNAIPPEQRKNYTDAPEGNDLEWIEEQQRILEEREIYEQEENEEEKKINQETLGQNSPTLRKKKTEAQLEKEKEKEKIKNITIPPSTFKNLNSKDTLSMHSGMKDQNSPNTSQSLIDDENQRSTQIFEKLIRSIRQQLLTEVGKKKQCNFDYMNLTTEQKHQKSSTYSVSILRSRAKTLDTIAQLISQIKNETQPQSITNTNTSSLAALQSLFSSRRNSSFSMSKKPESSQSPNINLRKILPRLLIRRIPQTPIMMLKMLLFDFFAVPSQKLYSVNQNESVGPPQLSQSQYFPQSTDIYTQNMMNTGISQQSAGNKNMNQKQLLMLNKYGKGGKRGSYERTRMTHKEFTANLAKMQFGPPEEKLVVDPMKILAVMCTSKSEIEGTHKAFTVCATFHRLAKLREIRLQRRIHIDGIDSSVPLNQIRKNIALILQVVIQERIQRRAMDQNTPGIIGEIPEEMTPRVSSQYFISNPSSPRFDYGYGDQYMPEIQEQTMETGWNNKNQINISSPKDALRNMETQQQKAVELLSSMAGENPVKPLYLPVNVIAQIFCPTNSATDSGNTIPARRSTFAPSRENLVRTLLSIKNLPKEPVSSTELFRLGNETKLTLHDLEASPTGMLILKSLKHFGAFKYL